MEKEVLILIKYTASQKCLKSPQNCSRHLIITTSVAPLLHLQETHRLALEKLKMWEPAVFWLLGLHPGSASMYYSLPAFGCATLSFSLLLQLILK